MAPIEDHPLRYQLVNELHARPFPVLKAPASAAYLALKPATDAAARDRSKDVAHLKALLDRYGAPHPEPGATHYFGELGKHRLKWESHTEFVTYTIFGEGTSDVPFDGTLFSVFPEDWLSAAPAARVASALIRVEESNGDADTAVAQKVDDWFVSESLAVSRVLDDSAIVASDFRLDPGGHVRFAVFTRPDTGERRIGRVVQRLCEIETYKTMSMLGFTRVRSMGPQLGALDKRLSALMAEMSGSGNAEGTLKALLEISSELENLAAQSSFRFGATAAYEALVNQRSAILREERFGGRQTVAEFLMRRFDPAMRTVKATERQLQQMSDRALRAGDLLRTRVDVERSAQNQALLESMDRRADAQLKLQRTVEGFSVAAISYYAVNLLGYVLGPTLATMGVSKGKTLALLTPLVIALVFIVVRKLRDRID